VAEEPVEEPAEPVSLGAWLLRTIFFGSLLAVLGADLYWTANDSGPAALITWPQKKLFHAYEMKITFVALFFAEIGVLLGAVWLVSAVLSLVRGSPPDSGAPHDDAHPH
jgi:hypothetical protein